MQYTATEQIKRPKLLQITGPGGIRYAGGVQDWYPAPWQQKAGCGPTAGSNLLWYLAQSRERYNSLCTHDASTKAGFLRLMEDVWPHITPGNMGVNSSKIFISGMRGYAGPRGVDLTVRSLEVPALPFRRPSPAEMGDFLRRHLEADCPVAFLNLSNGQLKNLDNWHWVTLLSVNAENLTAEMADAGAIQVIDLALWLRTTTLGGAFVSCLPD